MKVLLTTDTVGGVWTFAVDLARSIDAEVHLATMGRALSTAQREHASDLILHESTYKVEWMPDPWRDVDAAGDWLLRLDAQIEPDVIHLNSLVHGHLPFRAPVMVTAHSCVLSWWEAVKGHPAPPEWNEYKARVAQSLSGASLLAAPSHAMLREVQSLYGYHGEATVIPNGRDAALYRPAAKEAFILAAGRVWDEAKNLVALDRVRTGVQWPIEIVGEGSPAGALAPHELAQLYARASIYAWPAKYEPFGLSVLEAALSGCALVLGDLPSLRENWNGAAEFVSTGDQLALALERLIADPVRLRDFASRARERASAFPLARMAFAYSSAYDTARSSSLCAS